MRENKAKKMMTDLNTAYDNIAKDFSNTRNKDSDLQIFAEIIKPNSTIIDLGCGNGRLLLMLTKISTTWRNPKFRYLGIDYNNSLINLAKKKFPGQNFIKGDQLSIPAEDNKADILFNIRAFHHIPSHNFRLEALKEMNRVLKKNGTLVITVWNLWQKKYAWQILKAISRSIITLGTYEYNDTFIPWGKNHKRYYHAFRKKELYNIIKKAGFRKITILDSKQCKSKDIVITAKK